MKKSFLSLILTCSLICTSFTIPAMGAETEPAAESVTYEAEGVAYEAESLTYEAEGVAYEAEAEVTEALEASIEEEPSEDEADTGISVSGNVALSFNVNLKEVTYGDPELAEYCNAAVAVFDTAEGDTTNFELNGDTIKVKGPYSSQFVPNTEEAALSFRVAADGKTLQVKMTKGCYPGKYTARVWVKNTNVSADYSLEVLDNTSRVKLYANKSEKSRTIYTTGKQKMTIPVSSWVTTAKGKTLKGQAVTYAVTHVEGVEKCEFNANTKKITVPQGFEGTEVLELTGSVKDSFDTVIEASPITLTITSVEESVGSLRFQKGPYAETFDYLDRDMTREISANSIEGYLVKGVVSQDDPETIGYSLKAKGKSIKLKKYNDEYYQIFETGKTGKTVITATSAVGNKKTEFTIDVKSVDNSSFKIYFVQDINENGLDDDLLEDNYVNTHTSIQFYVSEQSPDDRITPKLGHYKLSVTGGRFYEYEYEQYLVFEPTKENSVITLKTSAGTKTYHIKNTLWGADLPRVKNASLAVNRQYGFLSVDGKNALLKSINLKNAPKGELKIYATPDFREYFNIYNSRDIYGFIQCTSTAAMLGNATCKDGKLDVNLSGNYFYKSGKHKFLCYLFDTEGNAKSRPFYITIKVGKDAPVASAKLASKKVKIDKAVGATAEITIKNIKNMPAVSRIDLEDGNNSEGKNSFCSYFDFENGQVTATDYQKLDNGNIVVKIRLKDTDVTNMDLGGKLIITGSGNTGITQTIELPFTVELK